MVSGPLQCKIMILLLKERAASEHVSLSFLNETIEKWFQLSSTSTLLVSKHCEGWLLPRMHSCKMHGIILMLLKATPARKSLSHKHFTYINGTFLSLSLCISLETEEKLLFDIEIRFSIFFPKILFMIIWLRLNHAWQFPHNLSVTTLSYFTEVIAKHIAMQLFLSLLVKVLELWFNFLPSCLQFGTGLSLYLQ